MAKYILCNRDPWNISRQRCNKDLPGAGDPPVQPGAGRELVVPPSVRTNPPACNYNGMCPCPNSSGPPRWDHKGQCQTPCWDPFWIPCVMKDCASHMDSDGPFGNLSLWVKRETDWKWEDWKKHNKVWGRLPRNKKRPNILDQNANFVCLIPQFDDEQEDWSNCGCPCNCGCPPQPDPGWTKKCTKCKKPSQKFYMKECKLHYLPYILSFGVNNYKLRDRFSLLEKLT